MPSPGSGRDERGLCQPALFPCIRPCRPLRVGRGETADYQRVVTRTDANHRPRGGTCAGRGHQSREDGCLCVMVSSGAKRPRAIVFVDG